MHDHRCPNCGNSEWGYIFFRWGEGIVGCDICKEMEKQDIPMDEWEVDLGE